MGGVYVGSKMNSFGIWEGGLLRWMKNELIWNLGGGGLLHLIKNELIRNLVRGVFYVG